MATETVRCRCKGTGLIRDKREYMGVRICHEHTIPEDQDLPEEEFEFDDDWEDEEFDA